MEIKSDKHQNHSVQWTKDGLEVLIGNDSWTDNPLMITASDIISQVHVRVTRSGIDGDITVSFTGNLSPTREFSIPIVLTQSGGQNSIYLQKLLAFVQSHSAQQIQITHDQFIQILQ